MTTSQLGSNFYNFLQSKKINYEHSTYRDIWLADNMMYLIYNHYKVHLFKLFNFDFIFNFTQIINSFFSFAFHDSIFSKVWSHIIEDRN